MLEGLFFPGSVAGGTTATGSVNVANYVAPAPDAAVALESSNPAVAAVPATVTVPGPAAGGSASASIPITTRAVSAPTAVAITASFGGEVITGTITVNPPPPADSVAVTRAEYTVAKKQLRVEATSTSAAATLKAFVSATNELVGTLTNLGGGKYGGRFGWPVNPQNITVRSSLGGTATAAVVAK